MRLLTALASTVLLLAIALFPAGGNAEPSAGVAEPPGLWNGPMYGATPPTLSGAAVVDLDGLEALMASKPLLLDVGPATHKPENFPKGRPWLPTHRSIPGAVWMPGAGAAPLAAGREELFLRRIAELTSGDRSRPIVVFCHPRCWGSWNAGKRLVMQGYSGVRWFPAGIDAWQEMHETEAVQPDPAWKAEIGQ